MCVIKAPGEIPIQINNCDMRTHFTSELIMKSKSAMLALCIFTSTEAFAQAYEVPPSDSSLGSAPVISDAAMKECVKLYNETKWFADSVSSSSVNSYDQASVDAYNAKVQKHSEMVNSFNMNCAGKQSRSAYEAAQKLNQGAAQ